VEVEIWNWFFKAREEEIGRERFKELIAIAISELDFKKLDES
jgi:hypothetical protein